MDGYRMVGPIEMWLYSNAALINLLVLLGIFAFAMSVLVLAWQRWKFRPIFLLIAFSRSSFSSCVAVFSAR